MVELVCGGLDALDARRHQALGRPARAREIIDPGPDERECRLVVVRVTRLDDCDVDPARPVALKLAATVIPAVPPTTIKTLWCVVPAIMALPSNWPARCGLGHSLAKHRIIILNPMSIAVQHAHEGRRFFAPAPPPRQNVACGGVGLIRLCFRGILCRGLASWSDFVSGGTESSRTRRWRKADSNSRSR
jgi:hypothetical protein